MEETPTDKYVTVPVEKITDKPIGIAKFKEPIFKLGNFTGNYIEVDVTVYPIKSVSPEDQKQYTAVRFGQMNVIRFVESGKLYNFTRI